MSLQKLSPSHAEIIYNTTQIDFIYSEKKNNFTKIIDFKYDAWVYKCNDRSRPVFDLVVNQTVEVYKLYMQNSLLMIHFKDYNLKILGRVDYRMTDQNKKITLFGSHLMFLKVNVILLKNGNNFFI